MDRSMDVAIVTRSASRLGEFYGAVVGLEPAGEVRVSGVVPDGLLVRFRAGASTLKLLQFDDDPGQHAPSGGAAEATGLRYLTLGVDDLEACLDRCRAADHEVTLPATRLTEEVAIAFVKDPDGNLVELVGSSAPSDARRTL